MQFLEDSTASIFFFKDQEKINYSGAFHFNTKLSHSLIGSFESYQPGVFRLNLFLVELEHIGLGGVFSGFKKSNTPFSTPIVFYKISNSEKVVDHVKYFEELKNMYKPSRINKRKIPEFLKSIFGDESEQILKRYKDDLAKIFSMYFENPSDSFL
jgi:hypothetical protein